MLALWIWSRTMGKKSVEPIKLVIVPTGRHESEVVGLQAVANRMDAVWRLPGESLGAMAHRAVWSVRGSGPLLTYPTFRD